MDILSWIFALGAIAESGGGGLPPVTHYPKNVEEIMKLAEHYFGHLHANWYMTGIFNQWLVDNGFGKPEWFRLEDRHG